MGNIFYILVSAANKSLEIAGETMEHFYQEIINKG